MPIDSLMPESQDRRKELFHRAAGDCAELKYRLKFSPKGVRPSLRQFIRSFIKFYEDTIPDLEKNLSTKNKNEYKDQLREIKDLIDGEIQKEINSKTWTDGFYNYCKILTEEELL